MLKFKGGVPQISTMWRRLFIWMDQNAGKCKTATRFSTDQIRLSCPEPSETLEALLEDEVFDPTEIDYEVII